MNQISSITHKMFLLVVGICLIGAVFHIHQLHPDYILQDFDLDHHLTVKQPDCVSCLHLVNGLPGLQDSHIHYQTGENIYRTESFLPVIKRVIYSNNKSPSR